MPKVVLIKDWQPYEGARTRLAGRTVLVTQEGARQMIAAGIADLPSEIQEGGYGKVNLPVKAKKKISFDNDKTEE
jgi:hypothetical protein